MKNLVVLHDVSPDDNIDDLVDMVMEAVHGDGPWPEDDADDLDEKDIERSPSGDPHGEDLE